MYYLRCVFTVLECNSYSQYTDYNNYGNLLLLNSGISELIRLAKKFNPNIMMDVKVFALNDDLDCGNKFIEITGETMNIHAYEEIVIGGMSTKILKKMYFTSQWVSKNYYYPLNRLTQRILYPPILPPNPPPLLSPYSPIYYNPQPNYYNFNANNDDELCCCTIF